MSVVEFSRLFSMSAFEGLRVLRHHQSLASGVLFGDLVELVRRVDADAGALDFEAAFVLEEIVVTEAPVDDVIVFYRHCIEAIILRYQPIWAKIVTLGRQKLVQKLSRDEAQCFRLADLLLEPPNLAVVTWWDRVGGQVRLAADQLKLERARTAELLTLEHERGRLRSLGIDREPLWISIEDNTAGYDVLSYDTGSVEPTNRLIEVKSTITSPLRFKITRNEWQKARSFGQAYHFHLWNLQAQPPQLHQRSVPDVEPHIPSDNERGKWETADIPIISA